MIPDTSVTLTEDTNKLSDRWNLSRMRIINTVASVDDLRSPFLFRAANCNPFARDYAAAH